MGGKYCGSSSFYGALDILLLFCDHQETGSESREMEICVTEPLFTQKKYQSLFVTTISILYKMGEKYFGKLFISVELKVFPNLFVITKH